MGFFRLEYVVFDRLLRIIPDGSTLEFVMKAKVCVFKNKTKKIDYLNSVRRKRSLFTLPRFKILCFYFVIS